MVRSTWWFATAFTQSPMMLFVVRTLSFGGLGFSEFPNNKGIDKKTERQSVVIFIKMLDKLP